MDGHIRCTVCKALVLAEIYESHVLNCINHQKNLTNSLYIYSSTQVPKGMNLKRFVRDHLYVDPIAHNAYIRANRRTNASSRMLRGLTDVVELPDISSECPICMQYDDHMQSMPCKHVFCSFCIQKWLSLKKTCPICRKSL